ncbi:hypothetical protein [Pseudonocardia sp. H11422]|uniref:hypothetical protein n=1 Tax=Pseudonocardia sp. H11422 TaxID=2835866 RepID=UPI001BDCB995|nr:hypothetical protein [Pseudonocardia sp. H11422]
MTTVEVTVSPVAAPPDRLARVRSALAPAAVYLGVRLVGLLGLAWLAGRNGSALVDELHSWDGAWLLAIAGEGYAGVPADMVDAFGRRTPDTPLGFFPGYPATVAVAGWFTGGNLVAAGLVVSLLAGVVTAYALTRLGELVPGGSRRAGLLLTGLLAATPMGIVLSMTYTEALFCALAAWSLIGVLQRQWLLAGATCALAGLVRPTANALVLAVGLAALVAVVQRRDGVRPWLGGLLTATGLVGYLAHVAVHTGTPDGWFAIQRAGWGWYLDGGVETAAYLRDVLVAGERVFDLATLVVLAGAGVLLGASIAMRLPWPLLVYGAGVLFTVWATAGLMNTKIRLLIPAFVLLLPIALGLSRRRPATAVGVLVAAALGSAWFGGYALTIWGYGI